MNSINPPTPTGLIIIAFASPKGGVGKSTSCACLAGALAARGHRVHILDLDQNRTLDQWARQFPQRSRGIEVEPVADDGLIDRIKTLYSGGAGGFILIDVAGALHTTTIAAATLAHLTISPAKLSAPDIIEAVKLNHEMQRLGERLGKPINHRLLLNEVSPLSPTYQRAALHDAERAGLKPFETMLRIRAPFAEMFLTGEPPHFADPSRDTVQNAVKQLDALADEVLEAIYVDQQKAAA